LAAGVLSAAVDALLFPRLDADDSGVEIEVETEVESAAAAAVSALLSHPQALPPLLAHGEALAALQLVCERPVSAPAAAVATAAVAEDRLSELCARGAEHLLLCGCTRMRRTLLSPKELCAALLLVRFPPRGRPPSPHLLTLLLERLTADEVIAGEGCGSSCSRAAHAMAAGGSTPVAVACATRPLYWRCGREAEAQRERRVCAGVLRQALLMRGAAKTSPPPLSLLAATSLVEALGQAAAQTDPYARSVIHGQLALAVEHACGD